MNTKRKGNLAELSVILSFAKCGVPVLIPFGENEKYDIAVELNGELKTIQIKYAKIVNQCVKASISYSTKTNERIITNPYKDLVDFIVLWCCDNNKCYILSKEYHEKTMVDLRLKHPKNNTSITTVKWAKDFELDDFLDKICSLDENCVSNIIADNNNIFVCEYCENKHDGTYGTKRFCSSKCARGFSTKNKRNEINNTVKHKITNLYNQGKIKMFNRGIA